MTTKTKTAPAPVTAPAPSAPAATAAPAESSAAATPAPPPPITRPPIPQPERRVAGLTPTKEATADVQAKLAALPANAPHEAVMAAMGLSPDGSPLLEGAATEALAGATGEPAAVPAGEAATEGERPAWLPAKFKTPEDMAAAYTNLEKKLGQKAGEPLSVKAKGQDGKPVETPAEGAFKLDDAAMADLTQEWISEGGKLKEDTYARLEKVGITRAFADRFGQNEQARLDAHRDALLEEQGLTGEGFNELAAWARTSMKPEEIEAVEAMFQSQNPAQHRVALTYLKNAHAKANPPKPKPRVQGAPAGSTVGSPISTGAEFQAAVADPRYRLEGQAGNAYRAEVFARIKAGGYSVG